MAKVFFIVLIVLPQASFAFAGFGHKVICAAAYELSQPETKAFIDKVVQQGKVAKTYNFSVQAIKAKTAKDVESAFATGCTWPDAVKRTTHKETVEYHYMNVPKALGFDHARDCVAFDCVTQAIQRYAFDLSRSSAHRNAKKEALFFLGHFVADLHQPLHVGSTEDRGGNQINVYKTLKKTKADANLHWLWDKDVPYRAGLGKSFSQDKLVEAVEKAPRQGWQTLNVEAWAKGSHCVAKQYVYKLPSGETIVNGSRLTRAYYDRASPVIYEQFMKASVRLAFLLDKVAAGELDAASFQFPASPAACL